MEGEALDGKFDLGEFATPQTQREMAILPCVFVEEMSVECILQDNLGRTISNQSFEVDVSTINLNIDISKCKAGDYHAWIFVKDKTFVRHLKVEKTEEPNFFGQFMKLFN